MNINIYEYADYRKFLKDFYDEAKTVKSCFSHRYFSKKAGFSSPNMLYLIIEGKRNLSKESIHKFSKALNLSKREQQYFEIMVSFNQAKDPESRRYYLELMQNLTKNKIGTLLSDEQFEYISNWYYPVIRELVLLPDFREDPKWIKRRLLKKVTLKQASDALDKLVRLGFLKRNEKGQLEVTEESLITEEDVMDVAVYYFHRQMLAVVRDILAKINGYDREVSGITMALSKEQFKVVKKRIQEFEDEIIRYVTCNPQTPDNVYQLNTQFVPLTKDNGRKDNR